MQQNTTKKDLAQDFAAFEKKLADLPLANYRAGETVLRAGSQTGQLLFLKSGAVAILKDSVEIAEVRQRGAVLGELSALLGEPHGADVRALEDSEFYLADASSLRDDRTALLHVARILARRLVMADNVLAEQKRQLPKDGSSGALSRVLQRFEAALRAGESHVVSGM